MAQNITLLGANYPDVPAVELPKTGGGTASFTDVTDSTVTSGTMLSGTTAYNSSGAKITGNIQSQAAQTIIPTTVDQTIASGKYLSGTQTIKGDANLIATNIADGVTIFGITGTAEGGLVSTDALLRVQAPARSTVTISKDGIVKSDNGHENSKNHTLYDYYFIIHQSQFDSVNGWSVYATRDGEQTAVYIVIIDMADEYDLSLDYLAPSDTYQNIEYLQATGSQYILTGITPVVDLKVELKVKTGTTGSAQNGFVGYNASGGGTAYRWRMMWSPHSTSKYGMYVGDSNGDWNVSFDNGGYTIEPVLFTFTQASKSQIENLQYGDVNETKTVASRTATASSRVIWLWLYKGFNGSTSYGNGRIYRFKVWNNSTNTLIADWVPCYRRADSMAGFYDRVGGGFHVNNGSGTFTMGPDV